MNNKQRKTKKLATKSKGKSPQQQQQKAKTPFSDAGAIVGRKLGSMFNAPYLGGVGKWLGSGIGQIFGSGDYTLVGERPQYNVLTNGAQVPRFTTTHASNIVCHREYLGDIQGAVAFINRPYPLNPGMATTFPWLSTVAQNYQEYKFHGLIFEFRPLITDFVTGGAPGVIVMATNYNSDIPTYQTKQEMENSEYAVSVKPTSALIHGVECEPSQNVLERLYVRSGALPSGQDLKFTDLGLFQFASQANPVQTLGELWVSYCVEFYKPILPTDVGGNVLSYYSERNTINMTTDPLGTVAASSRGDLGVIVTSKAIGVPIQPGNYYSIQVNWNQSGPSAFTFPVFTVAAPTATLIGLWPGAQSSYTGPPSGTVTAFASQVMIIRGEASSTNLAQITLGAGGIGAAAVNCSILVTQLSAEAMP